MSDSGNEKESATRNQSTVILPIITALITAITTMIVTFLTVQGSQNNVRLEMQSTINALQAQANQPTRVAQIVAITSTPNTNILSLDNVNGRSFAFNGSSNPGIYSWSALSIYHTSTSKRYVLDYTLPDKGFTFVGLATTYEPLINFAPYTTLEFKIQTPKSVISYQVKLADKAGHEKYLPLTTTASNEKGVTISMQDGMQIVDIQLRGNFDEVNLEQITEFTIATNSDLDKGTNSITVSEMKLIK